MRIVEPFTFAGGQPDFTNKTLFLQGLKERLVSGALSWEEATQELAEFVHYGQTRRSSDKPYIHHVLEVLNGPDIYPHLGYQYNAMERMLALAHDVIEARFKEDNSQDWTLDDFRYLGYSEEFIANLDALTRRDHETYGEYIMRLSHFPSAAKVKLFDNFSNLFDEPGVVQEARYTVSIPYLGKVLAGELESGANIEMFANSVGLGPKYNLAMTRPHVRHASLVAK